MGLLLIVLEWRDQGYFVVSFDGTGDDMCGTWGGILVGVIMTAF